LGQPSSFAFLPGDTREERLRSLELRNVKPVLFPVQDKTKSLQDLLDDCATEPDGPDHLIIFEPGMTTKLDQLLQAIEECNSASRISVLGIVTTNPSLAARAQQWGERQYIKIRVVPFVVRDTGLTNEIVQAVLANPVRWTAIVAPYEYATKDAADFADHYNSRRGAPGLLTHSSSAAHLSRDKTLFKKFVRDSFPNDPVVLPIAFEEISLKPNDGWRDLLEAISHTEPAQKTSEVVVKPVDASGSTGVRPIDLKEKPDKTEMKLRDLLRVLQSMPVEAETSKCDTSRLLVEERVRGEEFSVESRRSLGRIEAIAAHWKVDIDGDKTRFFERIFVTLPNDSDTFKILERGNSSLLGKMEVADGVFHGEYRMSDDLKKVYPLEVGLRPGGGMVNYSVKAARGVDLHETSILCSLKAETQPINRDGVVATGLVFATSAEGGVLPPIRFVDGAEALTVVSGDVESLRERLQHLMDSTARARAYDALCLIVDRDNALCEGMRSSFSDRGGYGLRATVDLIEVWMKPGDLITEEEAAYVAGLRISVANGLGPLEAMAEAASAMRLCLDCLRCEPEEPLQAFSWRSSHEQGRPAWWESARDSTFVSDVDSWNFSRGLANLAERKVSSVLDLGCGSAKAAIPLLFSGTHYTGVDVQPAAIAEARGNFAKIIDDRPGAVRPTTELIVGDVLDDALLKKLGGKRWDAIVANLPYLPGPPELTIDVNGGDDGLRFSPARVLEIADAVGAHYVVINISSLCDLKTFPIGSPRRDMERFTWSRPSLNSASTPRAFTTISRAKSSRGCSAWRRIFVR
jgi:ATP-grasp domain/Methyltransferase domain